MKYTKEQRLQIIVQYQRLRLNRRILRHTQSMSKEELIQELVKARIAEVRLKKGYEVKGMVQSFVTSTRIPGNHGAFRRIPSEALMRDNGC